MTIRTELKHSWIIMIKEFRQLFRKKALLVPLFLFPIIMIVFFGYGMGGTVKNAPILIVNDDTGTASGPLVQEIGSYTPKYGGNPMFSITYTKDMSQSEAESKIDAGLYKAVLLIPHDYSDRVAKNESTTLTLLTDSSDTTTSGIIINFMKQFLAKAGPVSLNIPKIYGDLEYLDFLTPAVIALTIFFGSVATTGSAIAGEKQDGTIVRILMTPVSKRSVILGKTLYQLILQLARAVILIFAAFAIMGFKMNGSWLLVALVLVIFTLGGVGLGIVMSAIADDMESFFQLNMLFTLPSMFVTGVFFPLSSIPDWMRYIAYLLPLTYANNAMRAIMIKGQGLNAISTDLIILSLFALITFTAGVRLFRREA
ncbi:MAG: ABC transporter permease [Methanosarcina sp.]|mgnify:FL=1|jgi:ABC-2 type transport system permease protein|nr:ABC transporter permease [Methanosarcina sp.]MDD4306634.1 ABC transporter permease [Methanosarcina sp.]MDD4621163.1 ABC transporter permease [Methanosarcina sp.]